MALVGGALRVMLVVAVALSAAEQDDAPDAPEEESSLWGTTGTATDGEPSAPPTPAPRRPNGAVHAASLCFAPLRGECLQDTARYCALAHAYQHELTAAAGADLGLRPTAVLGLGGGRCRYTPTCAPGQCAVDVDVDPAAVTAAALRARVDACGSGAAPCRALRDAGFISGAASGAGLGAANGGADDGDVFPWWWVVAPLALLSCSMAVAACLFLRRRQAAREVAFAQSAAALESLLAPQQVYGEGAAGPLAPEPPTAASAASASPPPPPPAAPQTAADFRPPTADAFQAPPPTSRATPQTAADFSPPSNDVFDAILHQEEAAGWAAGRPPHTPRGKEEELPPPSPQDAGPHAMTSAPPPAPYYSTATFSVPREPRSPVGVRPNLRYFNI
eukprot:TRINITY_DN2137_c0_g1_i1.p1 TRINITY_DN2137_c0_g1~~TRINITY_DN2137_c0_g1_i1.p1  ORF type:complete len:390 (+),score=101.84 TRINITY_DN2137_c0_g1_i1:1481-2650(+)